MLDVKTNMVQSGIESVFEFNIKSNNFLIKNFSSSIIRVCLGEIFDQSKSICIKENGYEELSDDNVKFNLYDKVVVMPDGDGEVEIQCLKE